VYILVPKRNKSVYLYQHAPVTSFVPFILRVKPLKATVKQSYRWF